MSNIHQELTLDAPVEKVFHALADLAELGKITGVPASGGAKEGEAFSAFGGHITGRQVELVKDKRIVQAWRAKTWPEGKYSLARFELHADAAKTRIVFDHDGFPEDSKEHLAKGWEDNYWVHLKKAFGG